MKRVFVVTVVYLAIAALGHARERARSVTCGCQPDCWCKRPGLGVFRWVFPMGIAETMELWLQFAVAGVGVLVLLASGLRVTRYSRGHVTICLTVVGRGLYFSRTPDGIWCRLRLRRRTPRCGWSEPGDQPPDIGVREPRKPPGRGPVAAARLDRA